MDKYKIIFTRTAEKDLQKLPTEKLRRAVKEKIAGLETKPMPAVLAKKIGNMSDNPAVPIYRLRQNDYRILYGVNEETNCVDVLRIGHRKNIYRGRIT